MTRGEMLAELRRLEDGLPDHQLAMVFYVVQRVASGERLVPPRDGIDTAAEVAAHFCDLAVDRISEFIEYGSDAAVSPSRISAPRSRPKT